MGTGRRPLQWVSRLRRVVFYGLAGSLVLTLAYTAASYAVLSDRQNGGFNTLTLTPEQGHYANSSIDSKTWSLGGRSIAKQDTSQLQGKHIRQIADPAAYSFLSSDTSVRCRSAGICDTAPSCKEEDALACVSDTQERQEHIKKAALHTWNAYQATCWGRDEFQPVSNTCEEWFNLGLTLVDGLDTILLMGLDKEAAAARNWIAHNMSCDQDNNKSNLFETTIRILGGLLSAFHLTGGDQLYLYTALDLGLRLLPAFNSSTGIPYSDINLHSHHASAPQWTPFSSLSEVSTLDMEFSYLARITGRPELEAPALHVMRMLADMPGKMGALAPMFVDPNKAAFHGNHITFGARSDSYYEYLLKAWLLTGKQHDWLLDMYVSTLRDVRRKLLHRSARNDLLFIAELDGDSVLNKMDHLVCFMPGLLALGWLHGVNSGQPGEPSDLELAEQLAHTCYELYRQTPTGLAPEIVFFTRKDEDTGYPKQHNADVGNGDFIVKPADAHNLLRPETVESLFIMWRVTRDIKYREWGWNVFRSFERFSHVSSGGYTNLESVLQIPPPQRDKQESFWLAETLKYLYLLFDDGANGEELVPLEQYVFNTEAHPLPIAGSAADQRVQHQYLTVAASARDWQFLAPNQSVNLLTADLTRVAALIDRHRAVSKASQQ